MVVAMIKKVTFIQNESDKLHFNILKDRVNQELLKLPKKRRIYAKVRAVIFPILYIVVYLVSTKFYDNTLMFIAIYGLMGIITVLVFLNMVHEAVHNNIFKKRKYNRLLLYFFDLIGSNSYIWKKRHIRLHHGYQNIAGWDSDIEQASLFRIYPHDPKKKLHSVQHFLIFLLYPLYLVNWVFVRDFKDFFNKKQVIRKVVKIPTIEYIKLFSFKLFFVFYTVVIPVLHGVSIVSATGAMFFMIVVAGVFALLILLTPHANSTNEFPLPDAQGRMSDSWLRHQFNTTNDIKINKWLSNNLMGNFNFHLIHHLFPRVSSVFAPELTKILENYAKQNELGYRSYTLSQALNYHYQLMKNNSLEL